MSVLFLSWEQAVRWLRTQPEHRALVEACYYDMPIRTAAERYWDSDEWRAVRALLPKPPGVALDLGAGNGIASYALARDGWGTFALEPDDSTEVGREAIRQLSLETGYDIRVLDGFGEAIPLASGSVDLVHARQVLHHAQDLGALCREAFRVLRPGGTLVATREHVISSSAQLPAFLEKHPLHRLYGGENAYELDQYLSALRAAGFQIRDVLKPFDSVVNYAPLDDSAIAAQVSDRLPWAALKRTTDSLLRRPRILRVVKVILSHIDRRPGRLFTFTASRPMGR